MWFELLFKEKVGVILQLSRNGSLAGSWDVVGDGGSRSEVRSASENALRKYDCSAMAIGFTRVRRELNESSERVDGKRTLFGMSCDHYLHSAVPLVVAEETSRPLSSEISSQVTCSSLSDRRALEILQKPSE